MPSPLAHLAAGYVVARAATPPPHPHHLRTAAVCMFFSMLPDIDAVPGIIFNDIGKYHNHLTHSILFGLLVCLAAVPLVGRLLPGKRRMHIFGMLGLCYGLHLLMDFFTRGGSGRLLLWPFYEGRFAATYTIFSGLRWSAGLISPAHLVTLANEIAVILLGYLVWRLYKIRTAHPSG